MGQAGNTHDVTVLYQCIRLEMGKHKVDVSKQAGATMVGRTRMTSVSLCLTGLDFPAQSH